ncbi:MAG: ankyrin repeat domain-containing protein [Comamonas sp.]
MRTNSHIGAAPSAARFSDLLVPASALATGFLHTSHMFPTGASPGNPIQRPASVATASTHAVDGLGMTRLMHAAMHGDIAAVVALLRAGAPVDLVDPTGSTALALAARAGHADIATTLLHAGADPDIAAVGGLTPLMIAAYYGFSSVMETLARHGADLEAVSHAGFTALMSAVHNDHLDTVRDLLDIGANPNTLSVSGSLLQLAAATARPEIVSALLQAGASLYPAGGSISPALIAAALEGRVDVVAVLVHAGVDLNAHLHIAAVGGITTWVSALLRVGANVNAQDEACGHTALMAAAVLGNVAVVNLLVRAGANVQVDFFAAAGRGLVAAGNALITQGADVNATDRSGVTPLMWAAENGHAAMVEALVQAGANIQARLHMPSQQGHTGATGMLLQMQVGGHTVTVNGFTALMLAALHGRPAVVAVLRSAGADIDADLHLAAERGSGAMVTALAAAGANVNRADASGITALMRAADHGNADAVNALLRAGANVHVRLPMVEDDGSAVAVADLPTTEGSTALMLAARHGHRAVVAALRQAGADIDADLRMAIELGGAGMVAALARAGADVNRADGSGITALMQAAGDGNVGVVNALLQAGANVHARLPMVEHHGSAGASAALPTAEVDGRTVAVEGYTALMLAMLYGRTAVGVALQRAGADVDADLRLVIGQSSVAMVVDTFARTGANFEATDAAGRTALMLAAQEGNAAMVTALLAAGAKVQAVSSNGVSALMLASIHNRTEVVEALLAGGAMVDAVAANGFTALMFAAMSGNTATARLLLQAGADVRAQSLDGRSARSLALSNGFVELENCLTAVDEARETAALNAFIASVLVDDDLPTVAGQAVPAVAHSAVFGQTSVNRGITYEPSQWAAASYPAAGDADKTMGYDATDLQPVELAGFLGSTAPT